ncbi:PilN domain-containing protein [Calditerrivibrio nitroreducens]|uniref:Fimbrial assembly family protein n=1 Tax=Calditerrivibrio nitroreducens (strain DSM 19672 / NBRC 101217 / Yu37-1) TaxID=768670 RepID=E4TEL4_CALNY|nr:PilN domain-containing protein [Calditerrivibrio nitroreducens]ADR19371.1 Fimbrial assembly family protein [Calditerrivibrio nitroreducens DSM 19672]
MIKVNLLGVKKRKKFDPIYVELALFLISLSLAVFLIFTTHTSLLSEISYYKNENAVLQGELNRLNKIKKEIDSFDKKKSELQKKIDIVKNLKKGQKGYSPLFINIEKALPDDVWIGNMNYNGNIITMNVTSLRSSSVNQFIMNLYKTKIFSNIELKVVKKGSVDKIDINDFSITANVNLGG